jgi:hypothetical protein
VSNFIGTFKNAADANRALALAGEEASKGNINLVTPSYEVHALPPMSAVSIRLYRPAQEQLFGVGGGKVAFTRSFIDALAQASRLQVVESVRTDDGATDAVCSFSVTVAQPTLEGGMVHHVGSKTMDLRDGAPQTKSVGNGLNTARQFIAEHAETKARNRAYRTALGLTSAGHRQNLLKPWVVVTLVPDIDETKLSAGFMDRVAAVHLGVYGQIFGGGPAMSAPQQHAPAQVPALPPEVDADEYADDPAGQGGQGGGQAAPQTQQRPPAAEQAQPARGNITAAQKSILADYVRNIGKDEFQQIAQHALGKPADSRTMTSAEAQVLIDALTKASMGEDEDLF